MDECIFSDYTLTRPPPREFDRVGTTGEKQKMSLPRTVDEKTRQNLSLQDMQRVARILHPSQLFILANVLKVINSSLKQLHN